MHKINLRQLSVAAVMLLSACKEEKSTDKALPARAESEAIVVAGKTVDASCFSLLLSDEQQLPGEGSAVPTASCRRDDLQPLHHDNYDPADYEYVYIADGGAQTPRAESEGRDGLMRYKVQGHIGNEYLVRYREETGSDSIGFESLVRVKIDKRGVSLKNVYVSGGDRCSGGIAAASIEKDTAVYSLNLTPDGLYTLNVKGDDSNVTRNDSMDTDSNDAFDHAEGVCPARVEKYNDDIKRVVLVKDAPAAQHAFADPKRSACFAGIFNDAAARFPEGLNVEQFTAFRKRLIEQCR